jgi:hypothetical protein
MIERGGGELIKEICYPNPALAPTNATQPASKPMPAIPPCAGADMSSGVICSVVFDADITLGSCDEDGITLA